MDKKDFSLLASVAIKEFNFSFDEILNMINVKLSQGGANAGGSELSAHLQALNPDLR